ncbi:MAG: serine/threonine protein kinase [Cyanobacteria bacterium J06634_5]
MTSAENFSEGNLANPNEAKAPSNPKNSSAPTVAPSDLTDTLPTNALPTNAPPTVVSRRYKVLNVLGDGGFGKTFLVEDQHMPSRERCVLKQLKPTHHETPELRQMIETRFQREAAILETLGKSHDQIPRLYAYFAEGSQFYLVEEWIQGPTLAQKVEQEGPLQEALVQVIVAHLLPAIAHIHQQKIVHRDIKPDNIILRSQDGKPVLIDFGAVKETMNTAINHTQSAHSIVVGTPGYMPAEQLSGRPIYASDIYSLGMTAIYLLTGKHPQEMAIDPTSGKLLWREHVVGLSTEFGNFLDCATHISTQSRFSSVLEMHSILNALIAKQNTHQQEPPARSVADQTPDSFYAAPTPFPRVARPSTLKTAVVAPASPSDDSNPHQTENSPYQTPADPHGQATAQYRPESASVTANKHTTRNALVIGSLLGISIVAGAIAATEVLPGLLANRSEGPDIVEPTTPRPEPTTDSAINTPNKIEPTQKEPDTDEADTDKVATTPVKPTPTATPTAATPEANATVSGNSGSKNIRAGAGTTYSVVESLAVGSRLRIIEQSKDTEDFLWYQVVTPTGKTGWIAGQLLQVDEGLATSISSTSDQPSASGSQPATTTNTTPTVSTRPTETNTPANNRATNSSTTNSSTNAAIAGQGRDSKNIRSGPGTGYGVEHLAYPGDRITIRETAKDNGGYTWYKVYFPESGAEGWIASQLVNRD